MQAADAAMTMALTTDRFLGGRLEITQPANGFRAGIDAVLLAAAVPAQPGERVLELGCGVGTASLCLAERVAGLDLTGVEIQPDYADLARDNAVRAGRAMVVFAADLQALPAEIASRDFDQVFANPPYYHRAGRDAAQDAGRDLALAGQTPLSAWIDCAVRRLRPGGCLTVIQRPDRVPELLGALDARMGAIEFLPLIPREGRPASLVLIRARKGRRTPFSLRAPLVMHRGARHEMDADDYQPEVAKVLRNVAALPGFA